MNRNDVPDPPSLTDWVGGRSWTVNQSFIFKLKLI